MSVILLVGPLQPCLAPQWVGQWRGPSLVTWLCVLQEMLDEWLTCQGKWACPALYLDTILRRRWQQTYVVHCVLQEMLDERLTCECKWPEGHVRMITTFYLVLPLDK
jgi:hypothetical protein